MGIFSVYTGLIYNDIFSLPLSTAPSMWQLKETESGLKYIRDPSVGVYPFGVDYTWHLAENSLLFLNSYKMKMSILLGVLQVCVD